MTTLNPLFTGSPLTAELFEDFITRLKHDCEGAGVAEHCTAEVIFLVEKKERLYGIDTEYAQQLAVYREDSYYHSVIEFIADYGKEFLPKLDELCLKSYGKVFKEVDEFEQLLEIGELDGFTVFGYHEHWSLVNSHFTQSSADAFVSKHGHKYGGDLRVSQESQHRSFEFNAIKNAILSGNLVWKD